MASNYSRKKMLMFVPADDVLLLGICRWGNIFFTKYKDIMGIYSMDLIWFEFKIIPALNPILMYYMYDISLGNQL